MYATRLDRTGARVDTRRVRRAHVLFAASLLVACGAPPVEVDVRFEDAAVGERTQLVVVELYATPCDERGTEPIARWQAASGEQPMGEPVEVGAGCLVGAAYASDEEDLGALLARGEAAVLGERVELVLRSPRVTHVAPGRGHTCASVEGVGVFCWGYNMSGESGSGSTSPVSRPARLELPIGEVIAIAAGGYPGLSQSGHACAVLESGGERSLWCWGNNDDGQLGNGTTTSSATPVRVDIPSEELSGSVTLGAGVAHTCLAASQGGGFVWRCWGRNAEGQLGVGNTDSPVSTPPAGMSTQDISRIYTGRRHTCATNAAQRLFCWGDGRSGQTGRGLDVVTDVGSPVIQVVGLVAAGGTHTCAVVEGTVQCFGSNHCGQIDVSNTASCNDVEVATSDVIDVGSRFTVDVPLDGERVEQLTAGSVFNCALLSSGRAWCWGNGPLGELGVGTFTERGAGFVQREDGEPLEDIVELVAGEAHACAVTGDGALYCWGRNHHNRVQPDGLDCTAGQMPECNQPFAGRVLLP